MAGHPRPHPHRMRTPLEPPIGPLRSPAPRKPPTTPLPPFGVAPRDSKPQERPPIAVGRPKCLANKNNNKIYQIKL
jgi:hypothetical protein